MASRKYHRQSSQSSGSSSAARWRGTMTVTQTQGQTPPYQTMTTISPVNNPHHCRNQTSSRAHSPLWGCLLSYVSVRPGACCSLRKPRRMLWSHNRLPRPQAVIYERRALFQPLPSALQFASRHRCAFFLSDLVVAHAFPPHTSGFALQILDLSHIWSASDSDVIEPDDILHLSLQQRYPLTLPELLTAVAELLKRQQPDDGPWR